MARLAGVVALAVAGLAFIPTAAAAEPAEPTPATGDWTVDAAQIVAPLAELSPRDIAAFCPAYATLSADQKRDFWVDFLSAVALSESGQDAKRSRFHAMDSDAGRPTFRRGLLQISIESARRSIYRCDVDNPKALEEPRANLACGVRILTHWIESDGVIASDPAATGPRGGARYWPTLAKPMSRAGVEGRTAASPACAAAAPG